MIMFLQIAEFAKCVDHTIKFVVVRRCQNVFKKSVTELFSTTFQLSILR